MGASAGDPLLARVPRGGRATPSRCPPRRAMRAAWVPAKQAIPKRAPRRADRARRCAEAKRRFEDVTRPPPPPRVARAARRRARVSLAARGRPRRRARARDSRRSAPSCGRRSPRTATSPTRPSRSSCWSCCPLAAGALTSFFAGTSDDPRYVGLAQLRRHPHRARRAAPRARLVLSDAARDRRSGRCATSRSTSSSASRSGVVLCAPHDAPQGRLPRAPRAPVGRPELRHRARLEGHVPPPVRRRERAPRARSAPSPSRWFSHFSTAFAANVATNVWLGFPFMMVVALGALTGDPQGGRSRPRRSTARRAGSASGSSRCRCSSRRCSPPSSSARSGRSTCSTSCFSSRGGEPDGTTDILVSEAYRWAFTRDAQYGYAAAYAVLIFFILAGSSRLLSRVGGAREASA